MDTDPLAGHRFAGRGSCATAPRVRVAAVIAHSARQYHAEQFGRRGEICSFESGLTDFTTATTTRSPRDGLVKRFFRGARGSSSALRFSRLSGRARRSAPNSVQANPGHGLALRLLVL